MPSPALLVRQGLRRPDSLFPVSGVRSPVHWRAELDSRALQPSRFIGLQSSGHGRGWFHPGPLPCTCKRSLPLVLFSSRHRHVPRTGRARSRPTRSQRLGIPSAQCQAQTAGAQWHQATPESHGGRGSRSQPQRACCVCRAAEGQPELGRPGSDMGLRRHGLVGGALRWVPQLLVLPREPPAHPQPALRPGVGLCVRMRHRLQPRARPHARGFGNSAGVHPAQGAQASEGAFLSKWQRWGALWCVQAFISPPDVSGCVGASYIVQLVNIAIVVYNRTGELLAGPVTLFEVSRAAAWANPAVAHPHGMAQISCPERSTERKDEVAKVPCHARVVGL